jgi:hypothetical protein
MVDECIIDHRPESAQVQLIVVKDPATGVIYKVCFDDFNTQEATVAADGYFRMSNAYHLLLINRIKAAAGI